MSTPHTLTESVRVRLSPAEKAALEQRAAETDRSVSAVARYAIRLLLSLEVQR